ncbi:MAG: hypothetical protein U1E05_04320 [Patescibacteria group bacterium]|nr:hypothetical protein [Patescibacteria group bacterium]
MYRIGYASRVLIRVAGVQRGAGRAVLALRCKQFNGTEQMSWWPTCNVASQPTRRSGSGNEARHAMP